MISEKDTILSFMLMSQPIIFPECYIQLSASSPFYSHTQMSFIRNILLLFNKYSG